MGSKVERKFEMILPRVGTWINIRIYYRAGRRMVEAEDFLNKFQRWASAQADIRATALVGSQARCAAREDSDIDLVLLCERPHRYLENIEWTEQFGQNIQHQVEDYGKLVSLRVWYSGGPEVEFSLTGSDWAALPLDEGTQEVIRGGMQVLIEREALLSPFVQSWE